jgi:hypothetical protein
MPPIAPGAGSTHNAWSGAKGAGPTKSAFEAQQQEGSDAMTEQKRVHSPEWQKRRAEGEAAWEAALAKGTDPWQVERLAWEFAAYLEEVLEPAEFAELRRKNVEYLSKYPDGGVCASHDYLDAIQAMLDSFEAIVGRKFSHSAEDQLLFNRAWTVAKRKYLTGDAAASAMDQMRHFMAQEREFITRIWGNSGYVVMGIHDDPADGEFVNADSPEEAYQLWLDCHEDADPDVPVRVYPTPLRDDVGCWEFRPRRAAG